MWFAKILSRGTEQQTKWRCGRCEQGELMLQGRDIGEVIPGHHRTCPLRLVYPTPLPDQRMA